MSCSRGSVSGVITRVVEAGASAAQPAELKSGGLGRRTGSVGLPRVVEAGALGGAVDGADGRGAGWRTGCVGRPRVVEAGASAAQSTDLMSGGRVVGRSAWVNRGWSWPEPRRSAARGIEDDRDEGATGIVTSERQRAGLAAAAALLSTAAVALAAATSAELIAVDVRDGVRALAEVVGVEVG